MTTELTLLAWAMVLGLVQMLVAAMATTAQTGFGWAAGPRDEEKTPTGIAARLKRVQANFMETFPFFAVAVMACHVTNRDTAMTALGAELYFWGRIVYIPLYTLGVPFLRSLVWVVTLVGIVMLLAALLVPR
jgi:uncharacterized MAPEG superfamily protein